VKINNQDFLDAIEHYFPYDGPHSRDSVAGAATGAASLIRYLNNATGPGNSKQTLEWAATVYQVTSGVHALVANLDQLLRQLADAMEQQASDNPTLYDDRDDRPAGETAHEAAQWLETARQRSHTVAAALEAACEMSSHLGNRQ
jgi:hypothetical protein